MLPRQAVLLPSNLLVRMSLTLQMKVIWVCAAASHDNCYRPKTDSVAFALQCGSYLTEAISGPLYFGTSVRRPANRHTDMVHQNSTNDGDDL